MANIKLDWCDYWSFGLGLGLMPWAPGTFGSVLGLLLSLPTAYMSKYMAITWLCSLTLLSFYCCRQTYAKLGQKDHKAIVCDEVIGMMFTYMFIPLNIKRAFWGFVIFRCLDIIKPGPIGWMEDKRLGYVGVMADDIVAGLAGFTLLGLLF